MRKLVLCMAAGLVAAVSLGAGPRAQAQAKDEQAIRALETKFAMAFVAKDVDAIMKFYAPGDQLLVFDLITPRQYAGWDAYKKDWQDTFALMKDTPEFDTQDLGITTDGKLAWSHSIQHAKWTGTDGAPFEMTVRVTDCYKKIDGKWLIVLEHVSVPIDMTGPKPTPDMMSKP
ncbi:MAG: nuclear transport factor 2 family protein [Terracidiphilus sp.]